MKMSRVVSRENFSFMEDKRKTEKGCALGFRLVGGLHWVLDFWADLSEISIKASSC